MKSRQDCIREQKRCLLCLEVGHTRWDCRSKRSCYYCNKPSHNSSLCFQQFGRPKPEAQPQVGKGQEKKTNPANSHVVQVSPSLNPRASEFKPANVNAVQGQTETSGERKRGRRQGTAVMASAQIQVVGQRGTFTARAVFDDGSTLSFITSKLARKIGATTTGYEFRALGRFGDSSRQDTRYSTFEFSVQLQNGSQMIMEANAVEHVSTPLTLAPLDISECC